MSRALPRPLAAATALILAVTGLTALGAAPAYAADGAVTGTVFRDFDQDGKFDTGAAANSGVANDQGLAGVTVTAYDSANASWTTVSNAAGQYTLPIVNAVDDALRIEFTNLPAGYQPGAVSSTSADNGTSVQFVSVGDSNVDFSVNAPEDYSQPGAPMVTAIQSAGALNSTSAALPALAGIGYSNNFTSPQPGNFPGRVTLATYGEVGALSANVYQASSDSIFAAATYKRQSALGPLGLGGIYRVTDVTDASGKVSGAGAVENWLDVTLPPLSINLGTVPSNAARLLAAPNAPVNDTDAFAQAGKVGIGGMTLSPDGNTLYFINLFDKKLYSIDVSDPANPPTTFQSYDLGLGTGDRPWAVRIHRGEVYVGFVDSGETAAGPQPGSSALTAGLQSHVIKAPLTNLTSWTEVFTGTLGYTKGDVYQNNLAPQSQRWNTWTDTWTWAGGRVAQNNGGWHIYPQAVLSDLFFDADGFLTLGFADRTSIQGGNRNVAADPTVPGGNYETGASGDILIASPDGDGTFTLESNGVAGPRSTVNGPVNQGPGGREFYDDALNLGSAGGHQEVTLGGLAGIPGTGQVVSTTYDPLAGIRLAGLMWFNVQSGSPSAGYELTPDGGGSGAVGNFQKGGGLGGISLLAELAPVEVGNRVWFDADRDGIQDADEPPVGDVTVRLIQDGNVIGTAVTDADGEYYFSSDPDSDFYVPGFEPDGGEYTIEFAPPTGGNLFADDARFGTVPWTAVDFTAQETQPSAIGSNADPATGRYTFTVGGPGENDHTIDAGLIADAAFTVQKIIDDDGGPAADGQVFELVASAVDFRGAPIDLGPSGTIELEAGQTSPVVLVPVGALVQITESNSANYRGVLINPSEPTLVTGTVAEPLEFTVMNTLFEAGRFSVDKSVTGSEEGSVSETQEFTVSYTWPGLAEPLELVVTPGAGAVVSDDIPYGTVVTLSELTPVGAPPSVGWLTPIWSGEGITDNGDGTAALTIGDDTTIAASLENPTELVLGDFEITKVIGPDAAGSVPGDFEFTVEYSTNGGTSWTPLVVTKDDPTETVTGVVAGTVVLVREVPPASPAPDVEWGDPVFSGVGVTQGDDGVGSFTIVGDDSVDVTLTNPTARLYGQFSLTKDVTGGAAAQLEEDFVFEASYSYEGQVDNGLISLEDGEKFTSGPIPLGTEVTITEVVPTGGLPANTSWGTPVLHVNGAPVPNGGVITIDEQTVLEIVLENPTIVVPEVDIEKGDGNAGTIVNDADTMADGQVYLPGEKRTIEFTVANTGTDELREVTLTDSTISGGRIENLVWTLPGGETLEAVDQAGEWVAVWADTFGEGTTTWLPGQPITGTATLTVEAGDQPHVNSVEVTATGVYSGEPVDDEDAYNAFTGAIQVIKYDGGKADPTVKDMLNNWVTPTKPLSDASQDANTPLTAVKMEAGATMKVRWVVTNTGTTWLTNLTLDDSTLDGPSIAGDWTADLSPIGGPSTWSFVDDGPWTGVFEPGASFFAEGTLKLEANQTHADNVAVTGQVVVPEVDEEGVPTGDPSRDENEDPIVALRNGQPFTVSDDDPFHARAGAPLAMTGFDASGTPVLVLGSVLLLGLGMLFAVRRRQPRARHRG
jgi:LPXTG-motif cell wall-anchored protein